MVSRGVCGCGGVLGLSQVWPGLWVGSAHSITARHLSDHGISTLVWAAPEVHLPPLPKELKVHMIMVRDDAKENLQRYFPVAAQAFRECRVRGEDLAVVCRVGKSRSASLALAALISLPEANLSLRDAYLTVKAARPIIRPNTGFFAQLISHEKAVRGEASVSMVESPAGQADQLLPTIYVEAMSSAVPGSTFTSFVPI